jgi:GTP-binding protein
MPAHRRPGTGDEQGPGVSQIRGRADPEIPGSTGDLVRPVIAIVGRPNVGKSTLFNRLVGRRQALVRDIPGVTRDRLYGLVAFDRWHATVIDTGGFDPSSEEPLIDAVRRQVLAAVEESDLVLFVVDARAGLVPLDEEIAASLRKAGRPVLLVANKVEGQTQEHELAELWALGLGDPLPVSSEHGRGVAELLEAARARVADDRSASGAEPRSRPARVLAVPVAIIGRPNVGKSSLVNALVGTERVLVHAEPGTTRDAVDTPFTYGDRRYVLIDTAGIRRKGRVTEPLEKLAVLMALRSLERCRVAIQLVDATEGITSQDAHIAGYANEAGRATVIAVNKWDLVPPGMVRRAEVVEQIRDRLPFLDYAPVCFTSSVTGEGLPELFTMVEQVVAEARHRVPAGAVRDVLESALARRPVSIRGVPLTIQAATQVGIEPPSFVVRVNRPTDIHFSYERYLVNSLRRTFGFAGSPIRLIFRQAAGRRPRRRQH